MRQSSYDRTRGLYTRYYFARQLPAGTVRVDGRDVALGRGRSATVETGAEFTWQVEGRGSEVGSAANPEKRVGCAQMI